MRNRRQEQSKKWYAMYTRFKSEKIAAEYFDKQGIEAYVPVLSKTKRYTRKIKTYSIPLISCYVFVRLDSVNRNVALKNPYVLRFTSIGKEVIPIPDHEILLLKKITGELNSIELIDARDLRIGDQVEIIHGNLTGLKGYIIENRGSQDFVVGLDHIGIQLKIEISPRHLRTIEKRSKKQLPEPI